MGGQSKALHRTCLRQGGRTEEHGAHVGYAREQVHAPVLEHDGCRAVVGEKETVVTRQEPESRDTEGRRYMVYSSSIADAICLQP